MACKHNELDVLACPGCYREKVEELERARAEAEKRAGLSKSDVRSIAARLLDDMCANMQLFKTFDDDAVTEVAHSLGEMLDEHCLLAPTPGPGAKEGEGHG